MITIVHTRAAVVLTKRRFHDRVEVEAAYTDYMASLGPFELEELLDYLAIEYPSNPPFLEPDVRAFALSSDDELISKNA